MSGSRPAEIRLVDISLLPEFRNRGLGTSLLRDLFTEAEAAGKPLTIHVEKFNPAMRLYQRLGFVRVPEKDWSPLPGVELLGLRLDLTAPG